MSRSRARRALVAVAAATASLVAIAPAGAAAETIAYENPGVSPWSQVCALEGVRTWGQTFTAPQTMSVTSAAMAVLSDDSGLVYELREVVNGAPASVLATTNGPSTAEVDGPHKYQRATFAEPVQLIGGNRYALSLGREGCAGIGNNGGPGEMWYIGTNGLVIDYAGTYDLRIRIYGGPAATAPVITTPGDQVVEGNTAGGAEASFPVSASADGSPVAVACTPDASGTFPLGATDVACTATGPTGLTTTAGFQVRVVDTTAPTLAVPADITREATSPAGAAASFAATATDVVDSDVDVACSADSGGTFARGATEVSCTAIDDTGNTVTRSFTVNVVDTTAPALTVPGAITVDATSKTGATVVYAASAADVVDGSVVPSCTPASAATFAVGDTTVDCTATDAAGNATTESFVVHVSGADEQLRSLASVVTDVGTGSSLSGKVDSIQASLAAGRTDDALGTLKALRNQVRAQAGKKLTAVQATSIMASIDRIVAALG